MTDPDYSAVCAAVADAFVAAYPAHLRSRIDQIAPEADIADGVRQGVEWLTAEMRQWAATPAAEQRQGPLHIMQTAYAFPTTALEAAGVEPLRRDSGSAEALPGDLYALAPVSSRDLGEAAWRAHIAWGVAKAKEVTDAVPAAEKRHRAAVAVVTMDQADRASVHLAAAGRGIPSRHWRNPGAIAAGLETEIPRWSVVDMKHAAADEAVRMLAAAGTKVAVYGPEPDDIAMARWMALGAATVVPHNKLIAVLESWLPLQA